MLTSEEPDCLPGPAGQSDTFQDPFQIDGEGYEQQSGERGRGTGLRDKQALPFGGRVGGHQLLPLKGVEHGAGAGMRRTLPEGGRERQKSLIGSMMSAKINTTPEIKITLPTT